MKNAVFKGRHMRRPNDVSRKPGGGRDRLLATARDLFVRRGASNVGINDVTDTAGVARMTLYNNFASKEALTLAVYADLAESTLRELREMETAQRSEQERILAVFSLLDAKAQGADYRGCPFIHASLQAAEPHGPVYDLVRSYKKALRDHVFGLLKDDRVNRGDLADQIVMLLDGAVTEAYLKGVAHPGASAQRAATTLLQATSALGGGG